MFAGRSTSSSATTASAWMPKWFSISALSVCVLLALAINSKIEHAACMSLDRLNGGSESAGDSVQNDIQTAKQESVFDRDETLVVDDREYEAVPELGNTELYVLVPPGGTSERESVDKNTIEHVGGEDESSQNAVVNDGDMMMMESNDAPVVQIAQLLPAQTEEQVAVEQMTHDMANSEIVPEIVGDFNAPVVLPQVQMPQEEQLVKVEEEQASDELTDKLEELPVPAALVDDTQHVNEVSASEEAVSAPAKDESENVSGADSEDIEDQAVEANEPLADTIAEAVSEVEKDIAADLAADAEIEDGDTAEDNDKDTSDTAEVSDKDNSETAEVSEDEEKGPEADKFIEAEKEEAIESITAIENMLPVLETEELKPVEAATEIPKEDSEKPEMPVEVAEVEPAAEATHQVEVQVPVEEDTTPALATDSVLTTEEDHKETVEHAVETHDTMEHIDNVKLETAAQIEEEMNAEQPQKPSSETEPHASETETKLDTLTAEEQQAVETTNEIAEVDKEAEPVQQKVESVEKLAEEESESTAAKPDEPAKSPTNEIAQQEAVSVEQEHASAVVEVAQQEGEETTHIQPEEAAHIQAEEATHIQADEVPHISPEPEQTKVEATETPAASSEEKESESHAESAETASEMPVAPAQLPQHDELTPESIEENTVSQNEALTTQHAAETVVEEIKPLEDGSKDDEETPNAQVAEMLVEQPTAVDAAAIAHDNIATAAAAPPPPQTTATEQHETTSMLTTIIQAPQEPQQQQLIAAVEPSAPIKVEMVAQAVAPQQPTAATASPGVTVQAQIENDTQRPLNVMDSVLNYVNASLMQTNNKKPQQQQQQQQLALQQDTEDFSLKERRYDGAQVWRIVVQNDRDKYMADELQTKFDGQLWKEVKQEVDYLLKPQVLADAEKHIRAANLSRIVLIDNLQTAIETENPTLDEISQLQNRKGHRLTWQAYHRLEDIHGFFDYLAKTYPDLCTVETIGYSIQKRPLKILKISNGNAGNPGFWIDGGMHAREWISPAAVTYIANQLVEGWDDLPSYMRNINWYIHAVANPDGYEYTHTTDRLWRKNMRSHGRQCPGVDLNRNFGYKWGGKGTSANPCSQTYRGSKAFSEPETFYISKFISNFPRDTFHAYMSFHSYGQYILYPWGYDYLITTDKSDLERVARQAGTSITKASGVKYTVGAAATTLYPAAGGSDDWAKGFAGIKYTYTIEMGDTGRYGFVLPASHIEPNGRDGFTFVETVARAIVLGKESRKRAF